MSKTLLYLTIGVVGQLTIGCKKDKAEPSKTELLTTTNWRMTANVLVETRNGSTSTTDYYAAYPTCTRDNYLHFNADGTLYSDEGADVCQGVPQRQNGTWSFNSDQTALLDKSNPSAPASEILELSSTTLKLRAVSSGGPSSQTVSTVTFSAF